MHFLHRGIGGGGGENFVKNGWISLFCFGSMFLRYVHLSSRIFLRGATQARCGKKGSKTRSHLSVVENGMVNVVSDVHNFNTLSPSVHHHTTTAADCNTERSGDLKVTTQQLFPC